MEKRTILAFVLAAVVMLGWSIFNQRTMEQRRAELQERQAAARQDSLAAARFAPMEGEGEPDVREARDVSAKIVRPDVSVETVTGESDVTAEELFAEGGEEKKITVETDLYTAIFSSRGASFEKVIFKEFLDQEDLPLEIFMEDDSVVSPGVTVPVQGGSVDMSGYIFDVDVTEVYLREGEDTARLEFVLPLANGRWVIQRYLFHRSQYRIDLELDYSALPAFGDSYSLDWGRGLVSTEKDEKKDLQHFSTLFCVGDDLKKESLSFFKKNPKLEYTESPDWLGVRTKFFVFSLRPGEDTVERTRFEKAGENQITFSLTAGFERESGLIHSYVLYCGPIDYFTLKEQVPGQEMMVDMGWQLLKPIAKLILFFMVRIYQYLPNFGIVIILLSALTKLLFWPLSHKSMKSMHQMKEDMKKIQPEMDALKKKYKNEARKQQEEMLKLYKKHGMKNPAAQTLSGCLPMILQMPVFISLYRVLNSTINIRGESFLWVGDLSSPDIILVILMGVSMFAQQKLTVTDPKQAYMAYMMPVVFTFIFMNFPAGLVLYWLVNNLLSIIQQLLIHRSTQTATA